MPNYPDMATHMGGVPVSGFDWGAVGDVYYVAAAGTYKNNLLKRGVDGNKIYTLLSLAYAATTGGQNDVILVAPGAYAETAEIAWSKDNTHCIGLRGPVTHADYSEYNTVVYTITTQVNYTVNLTGDHCIFRNIGFNNGGNHATNLAAMMVNGYGNLFENVSFIGNLAANQLSAAAAADSRACRARVGRPCRRPA